MDNVGDGSGRIVAITMGFFFTKFCRGKIKLKRFYPQKKLQKAGRPGDHIRDHAFYELVDEI